MDLTEHQTREWYHDLLDALLDRENVSATVERGMVERAGLDGYIECEPDGSMTLTIRVPPTKTQEEYMAEGAYHGND